MQTHELSKYDFELVDQALSVEAKLSQGARRAKLERLRDQFRAAHTANLEIEE